MIEITYNPKGHIFTLANQNFSYSFFVNEFQMLESLYFGKRIHPLEEDHIDNIIDQFFEYYTEYNEKEKKEVIAKDHKVPQLYASLECPPYLRGDMSGHVIEIEHSDHSSVTDFRYQRYEIISGSVYEEELPHFRVDESNAKTLIIYLKDIKEDIELRIYYTLIEGIDGVIRHHQIINHSNEQVEVKRCYSTCLELPGMDYEVISVHGQYASDRLLERIPLTHSDLVFSHTSGGKNFHHNPMCMIKKKDASLNSGDVYGIGLVYSSNFCFEFHVNPLENTRFLGGIHDQNFAVVLEKEDSFTSPECVMIYSSSGEEGITHTFHKLIRNHLLRPEQKTIKKPILVNTWEGCFFSITTKKVLEYIDEAKKCGMDLVVLDDGWFGKRDDDTSSLGDWFINKDKIDLKYCVDYAHKQGIQFGLWIEPEMINFDSLLFKAHPEYALGDPTIDRTLIRHQFHLDLINEEAFQTIWEALKSIFDECPVDYVKWDYNRMILEPYSQALDTLHQKEIYHRLIKQTYRLMNLFCKRYPHVLLETCSGGGGRFDMGMLYYSSQIWGSDETDPILRTKIQYATYKFYPVSTIGSHVSARKYLSIKEKAAISLFGTFGYEFDITKLTDAQRKEILEANTWFHQYKKIIDEGDYYELMDPFTSEYVAFECIYQDHLISLFMNYIHAKWANRFLKFKGLDPNKKYLCHYDNHIYYGDYLMRIGLNISMNMESFTPLLIDIEGVEDE